MKKIILLLITAALFSYFIPNYGETREVSVGKYQLYIPSNIDSPDFVYLVTHFPGGFLQSNTRISRPLYVAMAVIPYSILKHIIPVPPSINDQVVSALAGSDRSSLWADTSGQEVAAAWGSLLCINFLLAFFALYFIRQGLQRAGLKEFQLFGILLLLLSFKFDTQILIPHTEMFDLLIPAYVFYLVSPVLGKEAIQQSEKWDTFHLAIIGILFLGKAILFLYVICIWGWFRLYGIKGIWKPIVILPLFNILYIIFFKISGIPYYQHEMEVYRQGVWFFDLTREQGFFSAVYMGFQKVIQIAYMTVSTFAPEIIIGTVFLIAGSDSAAISFPRQLKEFFVIYTASFLAFWTLIGYYPNRLIFTFYPVSISILAVLYYRIASDRRKPLLYGICIIYTFISFATTITV